MGKLCDPCSHAVPAWDEHLTCAQCRYTAGICTLDINITQPSKSGNGQATMTVTVPQDSNKHQVQSNEGAPRSKRQRRSGKPRSDKKE